MIAQQEDVASNTSMRSPGSRAWRTILAGGLVGGAFDMTYACILWGTMFGLSPIRIGQSVASGLLGRAALEGGVPVGIFGWVLHFCMTTIMAAFFYFLATKLPFLVRRAVLSGLAYGLGLYIVMNYVVVPLSAIGPRPTPETYIWVTGVLVHMFLVGLPIALFTRRALRTA